MDVTSYFNEIYDSTNKAILSYITAKCGHPDDVCDIFQETYMELYKYIQRKGVSQIINGGGLVHKIAKRRLIRYYDNKTRRPKTISLTVTDGDGQETEILELEADRFLTEDIAVNATMIEDALKLLKQKPADTQKVFHLFYYLDVPISAIAKQLKLSESNVKNKIYRTLNEIRAVISE